MSEKAVDVTPSVLRWARESQGLAVEDVAARMKKDAAIIESWEQGHDAPTYAQLETLAYTIYKRPIAVFFLPSAPVERSVRQEFRTLPDSELDALAPDTRYRLRVAHAHRLSLQELYEGVNPAAKKVFRDIQLEVGTDVRAAALSVREYLGVHLARQIAWADSDEALREWRKSVEDHGIFVFKHPFKQKEISGFSLFDEEFPIIYLNNSAAKSRQIFSLFHELGHILLHGNAITRFDELDLGRLSDNQQRIERFCNAVAAGILVPSADFTEQVRPGMRFDEATTERLARRYHVSRETILRRALDGGLVSQEYYVRMAEQWNIAAQARPERGYYYANQVAYLSDRFLRSVFRQRYEGKLTVDQVADYLEVKPQSVPGLEAQLLRKAQ